MTAEKGQMAICITLALLFSTVNLPPVCASAAQSGGGPNTVVAQVGDRRLTLKQLNASLSRDESLRAGDITPDVRRRTVEEWVLDQLFAMEAKRRKLHTRSDVTGELDDARAQVLSRWLVDDEMSRVKVTQGDLKEYYENHPEIFTMPERARISHIVVKTADEASAIMAQLETGADFEKLAREHSIGRVELGFINRSKNMSEFVRAAFYLKPGQISDVIETKQGYHIIKVEEKKPSRLLAFEELTDQVKKVLQVKLKHTKARQALLQLSVELGEKAKVIKNLEVLGFAPISQDDK